MRLRASSCIAAALRVRLTIRFGRVCWLFSAATLRGANQPGGGQQAGAARWPRGWRFRNLLEADKEAEAEDAAGKAAAFGPEDAAVLQSLAIYYSETNQTLKAAQAQAKYSAQGSGERARRASARSSFISMRRGRCSSNRSLRKPGDSERRRGAAAESAQLELALGVADYGLRRFDDAADAFLRTIEIAPETEQPYTFLGKILDQIPSRLPQVTQRFAEYEAAHPASADGISAARQGPGCAVARTGEGAGPA